jgi:hypothetical protein
MATLDSLDRKLDQVLRRLSILSLQGEIEMATIDDMLNELSELPTINDSLDLLFQKLQELIAAGSTDPTKLQDALAIITTQKARTKAAIVANTPAA